MFIDHKPASFKEIRKAGGAVTRAIFGYRWAAEYLKTWPSLGQKKALRLVFKPLIASYNIEQIHVIVIAFECWD